MNTTEVELWHGDYHNEDDWIDRCRQLGVNPNVERILLKVSEVITFDYQEDKS